MTVAENTADERWSNGDANGSRKGRRESGGRSGEREGEGRGEAGTDKAGVGRGATPWAPWWGEPCGAANAAVGMGGTGGGEGGGGEGGGGEGTPISTRRGKPCACATNVPSSLSTCPSLFLLLYLRVSGSVWKVRGEGCRAKEEDRKGRSPLAWNLTLHRWVLSAACSRDTATISGVVNSRILNGTL